MDKIFLEKYREAITFLEVDEFVILDDTDMFKAEEDFLNEGHPKRKTKKTLKK
jgi:hypothetical protein